MAGAASERPAGSRIPDWAPPSAAVEAGFVGTITARMRAQANQPNRNSGQFGRWRLTCSSAWTPASTSARAAASTRASNSAYE